MWVLGVESSCDETAAAIVSSEGDVASDVVHSQVKLHAPYGGVVPELASRDHLRAMGPVVREALTRAGRELRVGEGGVDAIAVTNRPGLIGALLVGVQVAKGLAFSTGVPLVGVDHLVGHLLAPFVKRTTTGPEGNRVRVLVEGADAPLSFPYVALLASGGHTALYRVDGPLPSQVRELGATRDDAAGEAFDKVAKLLGLGYPGGPIIDRMAKTGDATRVKLAAPMAHRKSLEFSFSGLKTQVAEWVASHKNEIDEKTVADVCASFQATATKVLVDKLVAASLQENVPLIVVTGGVAANSELRARTIEAGKANGLAVNVPPIASCTDNAAMIAYAGAQRFVRGERDDATLGAASVTCLPRRTRKGPGASSHA
jgi:N6-L-threonylcarbamoyladenine synthase